MRCFEVAECVKPGLRIARFPEPHVPMHRHDLIELEPKMDDLIRQVPGELKGDLVLRAAVVMLHGQQVRLGPEPANWRDDKALVYVYTPAGAGGTLELTANNYLEQFAGGRVEKVWQPFPSLGVSIIAGTAEPVLLDDVATLELLLVLEAGASFRITRTGDLQGASPEITVSWRDGQLHTSIPHRYRQIARGTKHRKQQAPDAPKAAASSRK